MKVVILAGGLGTRLAEETVIRPKPMVEIGGRPILWHIMKYYSHFGLNDFIICLGYKGYMIKEYFSNFFLHHSDVTFDFRTQKTTIHEQHVEPWSVTLVDTGEESGTGGRLKQVARYLDNETFCFTYGDGLCDVNLQSLLDYHRTHGCQATLTAVNPPGRFGAVSIGSNQAIEYFKEKPQGDDSWVNGGFFVLEPSVLDLIPNDSVAWEGEPIERLTSHGQLYAYKHSGFWQAMDTLRDKHQLQRLWESGQAPWKIW
jgi:glucose-1-phosphate cytidylyltransferase